MSELVLLVECSKETGTNWEPQITVKLSRPLELGLYLGSTGFGVLK